MKNFIKSNWLFLLLALINFISMLTGSIIGLIFFILCVGQILNKYGYLESLKSKFK
jgi:hypothetical protein